MGRARFDVHASVWRWRVGGGGVNHEVIWQPLSWLVNRNPSDLTLARLPGSSPEIRCAAPPADSKHLQRSRTDFSGFFFDFLHICREAGRELEKHHCCCIWKGEGSADARPSVVIWLLEAGFMLSMFDGAMRSCSDPWKRHH